MFLQMRPLLPLLVLSLLSLAQALSSSGSRVLVVIEEAAEKIKYSKFWADLEGAPLWTIPRASACLLQKADDMIPIQKGTTGSPLNPPKVKNFLYFGMESGHLTILFSFPQDRKVVPRIQPNSPS